MLRRVAASSPSIVVRSTVALVSSNSLVSATNTTTSKDFLSVRPRCQFRFASSVGGIEVRGQMEGNEEGGDALGDHNGMEEEDEGEVLDLVEASLQECHDLSIVLHENLQRLGAQRTRVQTRQGSRSYYRNSTDASKGMELYYVHMEKLLFHIAQPHVMPRLMQSAGRIKHNKREEFNKVGQMGGYRTDQPHKGLKILEMSSNSYAKMLRHAPYEAANVRSDMPAHVGENARSLRDDETLKILRALLTMKHPRVTDFMSTWLELVERAPAATFEATSIMSDGDDETAEETTSQK